MTSPVDPAALSPVLRPRSEASPLPAEAYTSGEVLGWELAELFEGSWVCVGREEDLPHPGDAVTGQVGNESILLIRGEDRRIRGFFNVCQHRGSRLVAEERCSLPGSLICPYHSWTYGLDGSLRAAQHMRDAVDFDKGRSGLSPVATDVMDGWVFVNVSGERGSLADYLADLPDRIARFDGGALRRVSRAEYVVAANWKILSENYQECYHCPTIHPELTRVTPYRSGRNEPSKGPWVGGPMDLAEGCNTMSVSGVTDRVPIPGLTEEDHRSVFYYSVLPNLWISLHPDYVLTHTVWPLSPNRTRIVCEWLFHPAATEDDGFDPGDAIEFWDMVNRQDWAACERVQRGIGSRGFRGGRFSDMEGTIHSLSAMFARAYLEGRFVGFDQLGLADAKGSTASAPDGEAPGAGQFSPQNSSRSERRSLRSGTGSISS